MNRSKARILTVVLGTTVAGAASAYYCDGALLQAYGRQLHRRWDAQISYYQG